MDAEDPRRKRRRISLDSNAPPPAPSSGSAFADLTGDSPEPEEPAGGRGSWGEKPLSGDEVPTNDEAYARQLQAEFDEENTQAISGADLAQDAQGSGSSPTNSTFDVDAALAKQLHEEFEKRGASIEPIKRPDSGYVEVSNTALQARDIQAAVRALIQPILGESCVKCEKTLCQDTNVLSYAKAILERTDEIKRIPEVVNDAELICDSCEFVSECSPDPAVMIWALLCYFDTRSKHNNPIKKTQKPRSLSASKFTKHPYNPINNGTGYGGSSKPAKPHNPSNKTLKAALKVDDPGWDSDEYDGYDGTEIGDEDSDFASLYGQPHTLGPAPSATPATSKTTQSAQPTKSKSKKPQLPDPPQPAQQLSGDDSMTAQVITCLSILLSAIEWENTPAEQLRSLFLCSSILERAADLLRNNNLDDVTSQPALYASLVKLLETLSAHPSTSQLIFSERPVRPVAANLLQISLGKENFADSRCSDTTQPLSQCIRELAGQVDIMLKVPTTDVNEMQLFTSIKNFHAFLVGNGGQRKKAPAEMEKNAWHKDLSVSEAPDDHILPRHSLVTKHVAGTRPSGQMKRIMREIAVLKTSLPPGIFVRHCENRPDVMKILIIGPKDSPYENGLFEFDLFCDPTFPQGPPKMEFRTTGGGAVHFNPNLYPCGKICLSILGTWAGEPWDPKESTLLQVLVSIQAMILCESPWQNEPGRETIAKDDPQCKLYNKALYPHTIQTAMLDWLEKREFGKPEAPGRWGAGRTVAKPAAAKLETANIWADIVKLHFDDNAKDIMETVGKWVSEPVPKKLTGRRPPSGPPMTPPGGFPGTTHTGAPPGGWFHPPDPSMLPGPPKNLDAYQPPSAAMLGKGHVLGGQGTTKSGAPQPFLPAPTLSPSVTQKSGQSFFSQGFPQPYGQGHVLGGASSSLPPWKPTPPSGRGRGWGTPLGRGRGGPPPHMAYGQPQPLSLSPAYKGQILGGVSVSPSAADKSTEDTASAVKDATSKLKKATEEMNFDDAEEMSESETDMDMDIPMMSIQQLQDQEMEENQEMQAQPEIAGPAGTGWQGLTLGGVVPAVEDVNGLIAMLKGALNKLKKNGGGMMMDGAW